MKQQTTIAHIVVIELLRESDNERCVDIMISQMIYVLW
jgi:hypothetical protein